MASLAFSAKFNARSLLQDIDKVLVGFRGAANITAELSNTAVRRNPDEIQGEVLLFPFLDKGTKPHFVGDEETLMGNKERGFGPRWGPIFIAKGITPANISARVTAFVENKMQQRFSTGSAGSLPLPLVLSRQERFSMHVIRTLVKNVLLQTKRFAEIITPDNWGLVKSHYILKINGRTI